MFCILLFNSVHYVFLFFVCSVLYILSSSCQLALSYPDCSFSVLFTRRKANIRVYHAKMGHDPYSSNVVNCVVLCIFCVDCVVLCIVYVDCVVLCIVCV